MRYRLECHDRNGGEPYIHEQEARTPEAALSLAMMSGHAAVRVLDDTRPTPAPPQRTFAIREVPPMGVGELKSPAPATGGLGVAGFILACVGIVTSCFPIISAPLAIIGLVLALVSRPHTGLRTAAIVVGVVGLVFSALALGAWIALIPKPPGP